jgi:voltage-gated potassium channel
VRWRRVVGGAAGLFLVLAAGVVGYMIVEGWSLIDSAYMTVIALTTVGFSEVRPLSDTGKLFTMLLVVAGVAGLAYTFGRFVDLVVAGHIRGLWEVGRMERRIGRMQGHHIVAGLGRVGSEVAQTLEREGADFVVVDSDEPALEVAVDAGWAYVEGDATEEETLRLAGIDRARSLVTALDTDADNLFVTITGRTLNPDLVIVARSSHVSTEEKLLKAGADRVMTPNVIGGRRMAAMVLNPIVTDYLDLVSHSGGIEFRLEELEVPAGAELEGKSIAGARIRDTVGVLVLALRSADGRMNTNPSSDAVFRAGDHVVALGTQDQLERLADALRAR